MSTGNFIHLLLEPCFCLHNVFFCDGDGHAVDDDVDKLESVWTLGEEPLEAHSDEVFSVG